jgi:GT2 family glycosyltransferase
MLLLSYPFVSVIVLNYNGKKYLADLFQSLEKTDYPEDKFEVIMGDNGSTDDSVNFVESSFLFVKVLRFDENYGFCKGNNLCTNQARGQYVVFLNTDTVVTENWLKNLVNAVIKEKNVVTAGSKLLKPFDVNGKKVIDYAGGKITYELNFYEGLYEYDDGKYSVQKYTGFGCGAAVIVEKKFFEDVGGFDEYYFGGGEEVELGLRAWQYGFKVLYVPSSVVYHLRYSTFKTFNNYPTYEWAKSTCYFILKNYEYRNIIFYFSESLIFSHAPKLLLFLLERDIASFMSLMKGLFDFLFELKKKRLLHIIYQKRFEINKNKKFNDKELAQFGIVSSFGERIRYRIKTYQGWKSGKY